jgi:hypothetical protein
MSPESSGGKSLVYLGYDEKCSKEVVRAIVGAAASVYCIDLEILPNDSQEDRAKIDRLVYGSSPTSGLSSSEISIHRLVDTDYTVVVQANMADDSYGVFAEKLDKLEMTTLSLSKDLY